MLHVTCYIFLGNPAWLACSLHALDSLHAIWGPTAAAFQIGNKIIVNCACAEHARPFYSNVIVMPQLAIANSGNNIIVCFPWPIPNFVETTSFSCDTPSSGDMIIILCTHVHVFLQCRMPIHDMCILQCTCICLAPMASQDLQISKQNSFILVVSSGCGGWLQLPQTR